MIYNADNVIIPCLALNEQGLEIEEVTEIDTDNKTITCADLPVRVENNEIVKFKLKYDSVEIEFHKAFAEHPVKFVFSGLVRL